MNLEELNQELSKVPTDQHGAYLAAFWARHKGTEPEAIILKTLDLLRLQIYQSLLSPQPLVSRDFLAGALSAYDNFLAHLRIAEKIDLSAFDVPLTPDSLAPAGAAVVEGEDFIPKEGYPL